MKKSILGILLGVATFIGFDIYQQRTCQGPVYKYPQLANQDRYPREQELIAKYRYQQQLAANILHKITDVRFEGMDDIIEVNQQLGSAEGEEYTFLTQKREVLEEYVKTLESGMEILQEIVSCDVATVEGREKLDKVLSRLGVSGVSLEETAKNLDVAL